MNFHKVVNLFSPSLLLFLRMLLITLAQLFTHLSVEIKNNVSDMASQMGHCTWTRFYFTTKIIEIIEKKRKQKFHFSNLITLEHF